MMTNGMYHAKTITILLCKLRTCLRLQNDRQYHEQIKKNLLFTFFALTQLLVLWACSHDQIVQSNENGLPAGYEERYYQGMRYGLFIPRSYDATRSFPLVVSLHGSTDTVSWDLSWYHDPIQSKDPCFVLTPKSLVRSSGWGTSWAAEHSTDMKKTLEVVAALQEEFNLDANRLYIYGVSMGGYGVFSVLAKEPGMFAAAFSICGAGNPATAAIMAQTPLWIFHGSNDRVVPVEYSRNMYTAILAAGGKQVRYTEYPGVDHAAWTPAWEEPTLEAWLLAQEKGVAHGAPDGVTNFRYELVNNSQVKLLWEAPSNRANSDQQVWYYRIFRDAFVIAEVDQANTAFIDASVKGGSIYHYSVATVNYFFKESLQTSPIEVTLPSNLSL
jgi:poly(3-hydroxybutyrate) depolymerase